MKMRVSTATLIAGLIAALAAPAAAQTDIIHSHYDLSVASTANMKRIPLIAGLNSEDRHFLADIARANIAEIELGILAQRNGSDWGKGFGKDMEREHKIALDELKAVATKDGVDLPTDTDRASQHAYNMLSNLQGREFD